MVFPLTSLPPEIINSHILMYLGVDDIINLSKCVPIEISKEVYEHTFPDNAYFPHYDLEMFKRRAGARLYVMGNVSTQADELVTTFPEHFEGVLDDQCTRMHTPWKIETEGAVTQLAVETGRIGFISGYGDLYSSESADVHPPVTSKRKTYVDCEDDYAEGRSEAERQEYIRKQKEETQKLSQLLEDPNLSMISRRRLLRNSSRTDDEIMPPIAPVSTELRRISEQAFSQPRKPVRFAQAMPIRGVYAVDSDGYLWKWKLGDTEGTRVCLRESKTGQIITGEILQMQEDGLYGTGLIRGTGVVRFCGRTGFSPDIPNGVRAGYRCQDDHLCRLDITVLPGTEQVTEYQMTSIGAIHLKRDGTVVVTPNIEDDRRSKYIMSFNRHAPFVNIFAFRSRVFLVTSKQVVYDITVTGIDPSLRDSSSFTAYQLEGECQVASIASSYTHCLLLTTEGEVYAWGKEDSCCGCLGLGRLEDALKRDHVTLSEHSLVAQQPVRLDLPGKVYAISAVHKQSALLMDDVRPKKAQTHSSLVLLIT